ncbi:YbjN domain-containing protein [Corynebacterium tuberculostearicum]|uniref:YbjN domain-containing protein n=2 Tax=Corynebacterium TaxID=1716 RepID=A0AAE4SYI5_9CORY|nr:MULTISPECIES: YbjN domain-containing protein [Corynebacterium]MCG7444728.1 YbjN domain-containing protein [Corynebacterium sp. ACRPO]MCT1427859.1 YbjN domain-containing protein [Corynebacterium sp. p3-SID1241]MDK7047795.1 YbjN domain-containing protein [Corynebacterium sp. UMB0012]MDK8481819.1 YbjN domain-containing protein [Corynebacterium sp. MSK074]MDK8524022.1 YbjN domain-containing protein [Corynebacterium sp. MSK150]
MSEEPTLYPDTPVEPVTLERIGEIFASENLEYRLEEQPVSEEETVQILRTGFSNVAIAMQVRDDVLVADSVWRGNVPSSEGPSLLMVLNQWNQQHFAPTLRFFESAENNLAVSGVREINIAHGLSRNQIGAFVMSTLDSMLQSFAFVEEHYPQLVTWEEHNHD